jgi:anthranilate phosphoribosyltransferase
MTMTWARVLSTLLAGQALTRDEAAWAMGQIMDGDATPAQIGGFAVALRGKGETADEIAGLVATMLDRAARITVAGPAVDTCGTGGDLSYSVNISTMAAIVVAGTGTTVVKHGNRAASSSCGSADVLEGLGIAIDLPPAAVEECISRIGIGFCLAPVFHPAMRHAVGPRRELGIPTFFNFLGPLVNPAQPSAQAVGVPDARMAPLMASVLAERGTSALVFRGDDGLDELSTAGPSRVWRVREGTVSEEKLDPADLGIATATSEDLRGGAVDFNVAAVEAVLDGADGAVRDAVVLNAAASLVAVAGSDEPLVPLLAAAMTRATEAIDSGAAAEVLQRWITVSQELRPDDQG